MAAGRRLAAIVFTDIVGYTSLAQQDEPAALRLLREQERLVDPLLQIHRGRQVKSIGDGLLLEFPDALDAVACAVDLQRHVHERNARATTQPLWLRVGIHVGDVEGQGTDILGDAVNVASRVQPLAEPGGVCLSAQVFDQVHNKLPYALGTLGPKNLKGIRDPVEVYRVELPWTVEAVAPSSQTVPRLAVLPLTNMSPDPTDEYFADGLTEELISTISKIRDLNVISRTSVMQYKTHPKQVGEIGRELNVGTVLEGSVRKAGNRVRIAVQLIDARGDKHLWAENYDRSLEDVFQLQSEIARKIAAALEVRLREGERERMERPSTEVTEAHLLYMKGRFHFQRLTEEELRTALSYFEQAVQKDPRYALAYAAMSHTYGFLGWYDMIPHEEARLQQEALERKALEIDPTLAEAHMVFGLSLEDSWDLTGALKEIRRALELNPNLSEAHVQLGILYHFLGRTEEALAETQRALELDPVSVWTLDLAASNLLYCGRPERAAELYERAMAIDPANASALGNLGLCHVRLGRHEEGLGEMRRAMAMSAKVEPARQADLVYALAQAGRIEEARRVVSELVKYHEKEGRGAASVAGAFASIGAKDEAIAWLERAYEERSGFLITVPTDFMFDGIRADPRFQKFLEKVGLRSAATTT